MTRSHLITAQVYSIKGLHHPTATIVCRTTGPIQTTPLLIKWHSLKTMLQQAAVPSDSFQQQRYKSPPHPHSKGHNLISLLQAAAVPRDSLQPRRYKSPPYQGAQSHLTATTGYSTKGLIPRTQIQEPTLPRDVVSPHSYKKLQYQRIHSKHSNTRPHHNKEHSLTLLLQRAAV